MRSKFLAFAFLAALSIAAEAFAQRQPHQFSESATVSDETLAAQVQAGRSKMNGFDEKMEQKPRPFPWAFAGFTALALLSVAPIALRMYRSTSEEITAPQRTRRSGREEAEDEG